MRERVTSNKSGREGRRLADQSRPRRAPPQQLSDEAIELIAARLRVIAEPNRIRILGLLNEGEATVQELTDRLMTTHQNVSKHLGVLYQAGMVSRRKDGISVRYTLVDWTGWWLVEQMATSVADRLDELHGLFAADRGNAA
ncbi:winged helix-turn-helix transcriptional regulator [Thermoleophilia bacterium SCSIO 60948]|nr:winged helix-turn-helix transcriptional regulator [Thermoleophilia bacterium SCSIO 60948]